MQEDHELAELVELLRQCSVPLCVSVVGNISSGKSTLLRVFRSIVGEELVEAVLEPIDKLQNLGAREEDDEDASVVVEGGPFNLLEAFYADPSRNAYLFQSVIALMRAMNHQTPVAKKLRVMERCALGDFVFPKTLYKTGTMSAMEWQAYKSVFIRYLNRYLPRKPDLMVYLVLRPEKCHERMKKREREEETSVPLDYLQQLHDTHEEWMPEESGKSVEFATPYIRVSSLPDYTTDRGEQVKITVKILRVLVESIPYIEKEKKSQMEKSFREIVDNMKNAGLTPVVSY